MMLVAVYWRIGSAVLDPDVVNIGPEPCGCLFQLRDQAFGRHVLLCPVAEGPGCVG